MGSFFFKRGSLVMHKTIPFIDPKNIIKEPKEKWHPIPSIQFCTRVNIYLVLSQKSPLSKGSMTSCSEKGPVPERLLRTATKTFRHSWANVQGCHNMFPNIHSTPALPNCRCNMYGSESYGVGTTMKRPQRTSTPVKEIDVRTSESFSDSVNEFFYQSWKSELNSNIYDSARYKRRSSQAVQVQNFNYFVMNNIQPVWYPEQMVYFNRFPVYNQPYCGSYVYCNAVGYRPDGTYGILPDTWYCYYR